MFCLSVRERGRLCTPSLFVLFSLTAAIALGVQGGSSPLAGVSGAAPRAVGDGLGLCAGRCVAVYRQLPLAGKAAGLRLRSRGGGPLVF